MNNGTKSLAMQRLEKLLDENSFVELGALVTSRTTDFYSPHEQEYSDGVIIGHGLINGSLVFVYSQDVSVLHGTVGEMHAKKIASIYDKAMAMQAPVVGLIDCAGVRLQESMDSLEGLGMIYKKSAQASGVVPQLIGVFGECGGGLSILASMGDYVVMSEDAGLFINAPDTIDNNRMDKVNTKSARYQYEMGNVDMIGNEDELLEQLRKMYIVLPHDSRENLHVSECQDDINRSSEGLEDKIEDANAFVAELGDNYELVETKAGYGKEMFTGFIKLNGMTTGVIMNRKQVLSAAGCEKVADFVTLCDAFSLPVLSIVNVKGYETSMETEKSLAKAAAKMTYALASATVPKITLFVKEAYGTSYILMNAKSLGSDLVYAFPDSKISAMESESAARIIAGYSDADDINDIRKIYETKQSGVLAAARHGYIDRMVEPINTRKYIIAGIEMLYKKEIEFTYKKHGTK